MNGGNISDGQRETSGNGTEPLEVGGYEQNSQAIIEKRVQQIEYLEKRVAAGKAANNILNAKIRQLAREGQEKIDAMRAMFSDQTEELISARLVADKYIEKCDDLKGRVEELEAQLEDDA